LIGPGTARNNIIKTYLYETDHYSGCLHLLLSALLSTKPNCDRKSASWKSISEWGVPDFRDNRIAGFSTNMSLNSGQTAHFKIDVQGGANYTIKILSNWLLFRRWRTPGGRPWNIKRRQVNHKV
jgi:hypothetical protein